MISVYSMAAVFFMIAAAAAMYCNITTRSPFFLDIFGKRYARKSNLIVGTITRYEWGTGGGLCMICDVNGKEIQLPSSKTVVDETEKRDINLVLVKEKDFDVYLLQNHKNNKTYQECLVLDSKEISEYNKKAQILFLGAVVGFILGFTTLQSSPVLSCAIFWVSTAIFMLSRPLLCWKKCSECCKIYTKKPNELSNPVVNITKNSFPPDYEYLSQNQKDLYNISVRLDAKKTAGEENAQLKEADIPEEGWLNSKISEIGKDENCFEESSIYNGVAPKACKVCGCIIDNDAFFCQNCGTPQNEFANGFAKKWKEFEQFNTEEIVKKTIQDKEDEPVEAKTTEFGNIIEKTKETVFENSSNILENNQIIQQDEDSNHSPKRGKKSKNRRYRHTDGSSSTDVDKILKSLETTS